MVALKRQIIRYVFRKCADYYKRKNILSEELFSDGVFVIKDNIASWAKYGQYNTKKITAAIDNLKTGLDKESCTVVDHAIFIFLQIPYNFGVDSDFAFTDSMFAHFQTKLSNNEHRYDYSALPPFSLPPNKVFLPEVYDFHSGLTFLPLTQQNRLQHGEILDCGANWGDSALIFSLYKPRRIHCFEPLQKFVRELKETAEKNSISNLIQICERGVSNRKSEINEECDIPLISIDEYVKEHNVEPSLIKMDVEGAESAALLGAEETIRRHRPILLVSLYHTPKDFFEIKPYLQSLHSNYKFMIRSLVPDCPTGEVTLIAY